MPNTHEEEPSCSSSPNSREDTTSSSGSSSLLSKNMMIIQVKTKEGTDDTKEAHYHLSTASSTKQDAFLRYSSDEIRMNALMLSSSSSSIKIQASPQQRVERKTRLSWELHPSLLIEDMLLGSDFHHDSNEDGIDIEDLLRDMQMQIDEDDDTEHNNTEYLLNSLSRQ